MVAERMTPEVRAKVHNLWEEFEGLFTEITEKIARAGEIVAELLDNDPRAREKFRKMGLSGRSVARFERIGRGRLLPELATKSELYDHLPIPEQRRVLHEKVPALLDGPRGALKKDMVNLLEEEAHIQNRVIGDNRLRTLEEQKEYVEGFRPAVKTETSQKWRINKYGKVIFLANASYTYAELCEIVKAQKAFLEERGLPLE